MNNGDLISREALLKEFEWLLSVVNECSKGETQETIQRIKKAPAVDAAEVVRCRDCKFLSIYEESCESCGDVDEKCGVCKYTGNCARFDEYCSHGERRSE